jgi:hypothetical protein
MGGWGDEGSAHPPGRTHQADSDARGAGSLQGCILFSIFCNETVANVLA